MLGYELYDASSTDLPDVLRASLAQVDYFVLWRKLTPRVVIGTWFSRGCDC